MMKFGLEMTRTFIVKYDEAGWIRPHYVGVVYKREWQPLYVMGINSDKIPISE